MGLTVSRTMIWLLIFLALTTKTLTLESKVANITLPHHCNFSDPDCYAQGGKCMPAGGNTFCEKENITLCNSKDCTCCINCTQDDECRNSGKGYIGVCQPDTHHCNGIVSTILCKGESCRCCQDCTQDNECKNYGMGYSGVCQPETHKCDGMFDRGLCKGESCGCCLVKKCHQHDDCKNFLSGYTGVCQRNTEKCSGKRVDSLCPEESCHCCLTESNPCELNTVECVNAQGECQPKSNNCSIRLESDQPLCKEGCTCCRTRCSQERSCCQVGGTCISSSSSCPGRVHQGLCEGKCQCCVTTSCSEHTTTSCAKAYGECQSPDKKCAYEVGATEKLCDGDCKCCHRPCDTTRDCFLKGNFSMCILPTDPCKGTRYSGICDGKCDCCVPLM